MGWTGPLPDSVLRCMDREARRSLGPAGVTQAEAIEKRDARHEKDLQRQIADWLRLHDIPFHAARMDRRTTGPVGWPDFTFALRPQGQRYGVPVAIEVKLPGRKPDEEQQEVLRQLAGSGWAVAIVHSLDELRSFLSAVVGEKQAV